MDNEPLSPSPRCEDLWAGKEVRSSQSENHESLTALRCAYAMLKGRQVVG